MELSQKNVNKSGVYKITNVTTCKFYIGSAFNFKSRFNRHKSDLIRNVHPNKKLQNSVNKHGIESFKFDILAKCPKEYCLKLEQWFIDNLNPTYNISPTAGNTSGCKFKRRSSLSDTQILRALNSYTQGYSLSDISKKEKIKESILKSLVFKTEVAKELKVKINFQVPDKRKPIKGLNNKQQRFTKEELFAIAALYNKGCQPINIARHLFNCESMRFAITKLARGVSYKEHSHLFNQINYRGKQNQHGL